MSRGTWEHCKKVTEPFAYGAITLFGDPFQRSSARLVFCNFPAHPQLGQAMSHDTDEATPAGYHTKSVWALPRSLAATDGITIVFSS